MKARVDITLLAELARELREASETRTPVPPLVARHPELTVADAYAIQGLNAAGRATSGHKVGLTSKAMQEMLGVAEPDYGRVFTEALRATGAVVLRDELIAPRVEPEIAFVLRESLGQSGVTASEVIAATDYVLPSLEIIDSRIIDWKIGLIDTVADNASCGRVVIGTQRTSLADVALARSEVDLRVNGSEVAHGVGAAVLGHPAKAVAWLANALGEFGVGLEPGDVIMSGSMCAAAPLEAGDEVVADFGALGTVELRCR